MTLISEKINFFFLSFGFYDGHGLQCFLVNYLKPNQLSNGGCSDNDSDKIQSTV